MGSTQASGMADAVEEGMIGLDGALFWHLTANHYPPLPASLVAVAKRAISKANQGEWDAKLVLPAGGTVNGKRTMKVWQVVEWLHLSDFVKGEEDD